MKDLRNELLLKILNHKDWETQLDILELLKSKGAYIDEANQVGMLLKKEDVFNLTLPFFKVEFSDNRLTPFYEFLYLHIHSKEETLKKKGVINNIVSLVNFNKSYLYHKPSNKLNNGQEYRSSFEMMIENDCFEAVGELIKNGLINRKDIDDNKIDLIKAIGVNFLHISFHKDPPTLIKCFIENGIVSREEIFEELLRRSGTSESIYNGARKSVDSNTLSNMLYCVQGDFFKLSKLGMLDLLRKEDENTHALIEKFNQKMYKLLADVTQKRVTSLRGLVQSTNIYMDAMKEYLFILDPIKNLNNVKAERNLKGVDFSGSYIQKEFSDVLGYLKEKGAVSRFSSSDDTQKLEENIKTTLIEINKQFLDISLTKKDEQLSSPDRIKNKI